MKTIFWLIVVVMLIWGGYYFYQNYYQQSQSIPSLSDLTSTSSFNFAFSKAKGIASSTFDFLTEQSKSAISKTIDYFTPAVNELINQSKDFLASSTISAENKTLSAFNKSVLGITTTPQTINVSPNQTADIALVSSAGQKISFLIKASSTNTYQVDWGDGQKEAGSLTQNQDTVISHIWNNSGNYFVTITLDNSQKTIFPLSIY